MNLGQTLARYVIKQKEHNSRTETKLGPPMVFKMKTSKLPHIRQADNANLQVYPHSPYEGRWTSGLFLLLWWHYFLVYTAE